MPSYLITGASRGLGYTWLKHLSSNPQNTVVGLVRDKSSTHTHLLADRLTNAHLVCADITDPKALQTAAEQVGAITGGGLDVLINNAAILTPTSAFTPITDLAPEVLERDILQSCRTNVVGVAHTVNAFLPLIRRGRAKKVITISSLLADPDLVRHFALDNATPYAISKAAANLLMAKYHASLGATDGILFMAISPGAVSKPDTAPSEGEAEGRRRMVAKLQAYAPHFSSPMTMEDSVRWQLEVIENATVETHGGAFVSHLGNKQWL
ncbi:NAD(P)-binding protein [Aspergillus brunneoviolaceus CBS 621.78]|uniref:NAD(P)-binding protein n=1 Tax=Aspergillus brunneoviolaceus CBS 621.78 TaxID=1450534 RepID=A0ACD1FW64_9EURO|nr:NAD(P)-binding protein [Aspergillus brunneoviolaceus CBS 621.78]RAH41255.1 NAD(P)-binding protein [Aspergillus brunneoviolaceus CBS 621.78]